MVPHIKRRMVILILVFLSITPLYATSIVVHENGNVGMGTQNPATAFHVFKNDQNNKIAIFESLGGDNTYRDIAFYSNAGQGAILREYQRSTGGELQFITGGPSNSIVAQTIAPNGNIGIGTLSPSSKLHIQIPNYDNGTLLRLKSNLSWDFRIDNYGSGNGQDIGLITDSSYTRMILFNNTGNGTVNVGINRPNPSYPLDVNGTIRGDNVSPSDIRWKTNIQPIENALEKVSQLRGVNYEWTDPSKGIGNQIGVIAQEVEEVFPEAVSTDNQGYKSVAYAKLVGPLIEAVKELKKENAQLKKRIEKLESK